MKTDLQEVYTKGSLHKVTLNEWLFNCLNKVVA